MTILKFFVEGAAIGKARPRVTRSGTFMPTTYRAWINTVRDDVLVACGMLTLSGTPWDGSGDCYGVSMHFYLGDKRRRDVDNLAGAVLDACNGVLWADDSAVADLRVTKSIDKNRPGVDVEVWPIAARAKRLTKKETSR